MSKTKTIISIDLTQEMKYHKRSPNLIKAKLNSMSHPRPLNKPLLNLYQTIPQTSFSSMRYQLKFLPTKLLTQVHWQGILCNLKFEDFRMTTFLKNRVHLERLKLNAINRSINLSIKTQMKINKYQRRYPKKTISRMRNKRIQTLNLSLRRVRIMASLTILVA